MSVIYSNEIVEFFREKNLGIPDGDGDDNTFTSGKDGINRLRGTWIWNLLRPAKGIYRTLRFFFYALRDEGVGKSIKMVYKREKNSKAYINSLFPSEEECKRQRDYVFSSELKFSVIVPLYNTKRQYLKSMIESVCGQTYSNWELCLADASDSEHEYVGKICCEYAEREKRIVYRKLESNEGISENTNRAIEFSCGEYIVLLDHDDLLTPTALFDNRVYIEKTNADFLYSDEATFIKDNIHNIITYHFKPDFAPDNLRANNYICHLSVFRRTLLEKAGSFRKAFDGSQDHDLFLRLTEHAKHIEHIPKILYLWRAHKDSTSSNVESKTYAIENGICAVEDSIMRAGLKGTVECSPILPSIYRIQYDLVAQPKVSIIIPNTDSLLLLSRCLDSIIKRTTYDQYEIIIIDNHSADKNLLEFYHLLRDVENVQVLSYDKPYNYSAICNFATQYANGEYLVFLNSDMQIIDPNWMQELLMYAQRSDVGAVGAKIFDEAKKICHNGMIIGAGDDGIAMYSHSGESCSSAGYMGRLFYAQNISAVSSSCMMVSKKKFEQVKGFDEQLAYLYFDVDFCLKLRQLDFLNVVNPFATMYYCKSFPFGTYEKNLGEQLLSCDIEYMKEKWNKELKEGDPFYNSNVSKTKSWEFGV